MLISFFLSAWNDLDNFLTVLLSNLPSLKAMLLLAAMLGITAVVSSMLASLIDKLVLGKSDPPTFKVVRERGEARTVRVTKEKLDLLGWKEHQRISVSLSGIEPSRSVVAELLTRKKMGAFDNECCATSLAVLRELGIGDTSEDNALQLVLKELPWYSLAGAAYRTIKDPDPSVRLTWIVTLVSIAVSLAVSELYYQRGLQNQNDVPSLRSTIQETSMLPK